MYVCVCVHVLSCVHVSVAQLCVFGKRVTASTRNYVLLCLLCFHMHIKTYMHTHMSERARTTGRGQRRAAGTPKTQAPTCAPGLSAQVCAPRPARPGLRAARSARPLRSRLVAGAWGAAAPQPRMGRRRARSRGRLCRREERRHKVRIHLRSRRAHRCTVAGRGRAPRRCRRVRHCVLAFGSRGLDAC